MRTEYLRRASGGDHEDLFRLVPLPLVITITSEAKVHADSISDSPANPKGFLDRFRTVSGAALGSQSAPRHNNLLNWNGSADIVSNNRVDAWKAPKGRP